MDESNLWPGLGNVHSRWSINEQRQLDRMPSHVESAVAEAMWVITGIKPMRQETSWHMDLRRRFLVFDECEIVASVSAFSDTSSNVEVTISFDVSDPKLAVMMFLLTSVVGIPLAIAWRTASVRTSKSFARQFLDRFWTMLATTERHVYR